MQARRYTLVQRLIHWAVAIMVICALAAGFTIGALGFEGLKATFGDAITGAFYKYHKTLGVLILGLMLVRLVFKIAYGRPAHEPDIPAFNRIASEIVHGLLYVLLLLMPIVGWMATAAGDFPIQFFEWELPKILGKDEALSEWLYDVHEALGYAILGVAGLHVAAAIMHWKVRRDSVMRRMSLP